MDWEIGIIVIWGIGVFGYWDNGIMGYWDIGEWLRRVAVQRKVSYVPLNTSQGFFPFIPMQNSLKPTEIPQPRAVSPRWGCWEEWALSAPPCSPHSLQTSPVPPRPSPLHTFLPPSLSIYPLFRIILYYLLS
jgi:hypothetical protein